MRNVISVDAVTEGFQSRDEKATPKGIPGPQFDPAHPARPRKRVDLIYASAAPANGEYDSPEEGDAEYDLSVHAAKLLLLSQYIVAFTHAAQTVLRSPALNPTFHAWAADPTASGRGQGASPARGHAIVRLRLMPLGGGVFANSPTWIRDAILHAYNYVRTTHGPPTGIAGMPHPLDFVEVTMLTYNGPYRRAEGLTYSKLFNRLPIRHVASRSTITWQRVGGHVLPIMHPNPNPSQAMTRYDQYLKALDPKPKPKP